MTEEMPRHAYTFGAPDTCKNCGERAEHENHFFYREINAKWTGDKLAISCMKFRVVRRTPKGFWITPVWNYDDTRFLHFVLSGAGKRFAYPTRELARESFIRRKRREILKCGAQHDRAVRYLNLAETGIHGTETEALHEIKTPDEMVMENLVSIQFSKAQFARALAN